MKFYVVNYPYKYRDFAFISAQALLAAGAQGRYWEMHDLLIENSPDLDRASLLKYAGQLGLDMGRFTGDLDAMTHRARIDADVKMALDLDFYNTPTYVINGRVVVGNRPYGYMKKVIAEELANAGG